MSNFTAAAIQMHSIPGDITGNMEKALAGLETASVQGARMACLPELFNTGYLLEPHRLFDLAEALDGPVIQELQRVAVARQMIIIAPIAEKEKIPGVVYNTAVLIGDDGNIMGYTRKNYCWEKEKLAFKSGNGFPVFTTSVGRIGILICYDIEFPEPARIMALNGAELIFVPSCWGKKAEPRWNIQLPARALDNLLYVIGVNIVGEDVCGSSRIINPLGQVVAEASREKEEVLVAQIDLCEVVKARRTIPYLTDFQSELFYGPDY